MLIFRLSLIICISCTPLCALKLPSYTLACSRNDPNLNDCVVKHGQLAIPYFINGDPKYKVPRLDPLFITELTVQQGIRQIGIELTLKNSSIYGLKNAIFKKARTNITGQHIEWDFEIPKIYIIGHYEVSGRILILPITGNGKANVTITDLKITYKYDWDYITKKNGRKYMNITTSSLEYENGRTYFQLENLFNGDKLLGENMLTFLNENWKEVTTEIGPAIGEAISEVFRLILTSIADLVPWEYIYPDI
uniref:Protein takeout-like protein n=1 Tax=Maconellicoccus hirsutus TaxID=177089 RepID=A0AAU6SHL0_MACHI